LDFRAGDDVDDITGFDETLFRSLRQQQLDLRCNVFITQDPGTGAPITMQGQVTGGKKLMNLLMDFASTINPMALGFRDNE